MDEHTKTIQELLDKDSLTPNEVTEGVVACFFATNHAFVQQRLSMGSAQEVDDALSELITQIFKEHEVNPANPDLHFLKQAVKTLDNQAGFEADPDLLENHQKIIQTLFARAKK